MKITALVSILCLAANTIHAQSSQRMEVRSFTWLEGTWQNVRTGEFERWQLANDNKLDGMGFKVTGTDTTISERLTIECVAGACDYVANVRSNAAPVRFRIVESTNMGFKSSNPQHDFPQFINYELISANEIRATIGAGERKIAFEFKRVNSRP